MIPGFGIVRRLIVSALFLGALFVGANVLIENVAEDRIAAAVRKSFSLESDPTVEISGFPILVNAVTGNLPKVRIAASNFERDGLRLRSLAVELESISTEGGVLGGSELSISIGKGSATADADEAAINAYLKAQKANATITLKEPGKPTVTATRRIAGRNRRIVAAGTIKITVAKNGDRFLVFTAASATVDGKKPSKAVETEARKQSRISVRLPDMPAGIKLDAVEARAGFLRIAADLEGESVTFGGSGATFGDEEQ